MNFANAIENEINTTHNVARTENGALGYRTTTSALLDMNFAISSLRNKSVAEVEQMFSKAFYEDKILACRFLFYMGGVRHSGVGERRSFKICMKWLFQNEPEFCRALIPLVPEYTRWDNLWILLGSLVHNDVINLVKKQLKEDAENYKDNKPISLCAKWLPSLNCSSFETKQLAEMIRKDLNMSPRTYRKTLSTLRAYLKIVERDMSAKNWSEIDYNAVPSRANLIYKNAFLRNDEERRREFLAKLASGDKSVKINAGVLFPHDIVHKYTDGVGWRRTSVHNYDETLEQLWKNLNDTVGGAEDILVVADSSGSMTTTVDPNGGTTALEVANALAIYFSERCKGQFKDKYITFSSRPDWVDLSKGKNLHDKLAIAYHYNIVEDTNIEKTFDLILQTAIKNQMAQEDMPKTVLIISDMEMNGACTGRPDQKLFDAINDKFVRAGYKMMKLVFWNVNNRSGSIPVKSNGNGFPCALVSGFSTNVVKMVLSGELDPYKALLDVICAKDFDAVAAAVKDLV